MVISFSGIGKVIKERDEGEMNRSDFSIYWLRYFSGRN